MPQPKRMLISGSDLMNGTNLLLYYLHLGLECTKIKIHQFVQYTPENCFNSFLQSAVNARKQGDENPISSVVAETRKLCGKQLLWEPNRGFRTMKYSVATYEQKKKRLFSFYPKRLVEADERHNKPLDL